MKLKLNLPFKILIILITLLIVLNTLDILLTGAVLHYGGGEANTEIGPFYLFGIKIGPFNLWGHFNTEGIRTIDYALKIGSVFLMGGIIIVQYWFSLRKNSKFGFITTFVILIVLNIFYTYVVIHNIQILIAQKQIWENSQYICNIR